MAEIDLSIVIPCLNESETLSRVIREARVGLGRLEQLGLRGEVIVSDNGSNDGSQAIATAAGARVVNAPFRGYGAALHFGFLNARGRWVLFGDADLSYDFSVLEPFAPALLEPNPSQQLDVVLGTRLGGRIEPRAMPLLNRYLGTPALNLAIRIFFSLKTTDCNSGMRLVRRRFYVSLPMRATGMEWASEMLIKSQLKSMRYAEVPIGYRRDQRNRAPHLRRWRDGWRHLKTILFLSPDRLIILPSSAVALAAAFYVSSQRWNLALFCTLVSITGCSLGLILKLVLNSDGTLPSPAIIRLMRAPVPEYLLAAGSLLSIAGVVFYARFSATGPGLILAAMGMISILNAGAWGALSTHSLEALNALVKARRESDPDRNVDGDGDGQTDSGSIAA